MALGRIAALAIAATAAGIAGWNWYERGSPVDFGANGNAAAAERLERPATAGGEVNFQSFHDRLARSGTWLNHRRWGAVWRPGLGRGFRPYRDGGHWEDTSEYGTVWVSDYDWGDVPFHYGRWVYDPEDGWVWVPGYVWGPGWVVWRAGAGNIGWMPMPPMENYDGYGDFPDDWNDGYGYASLGYPQDQFYGFWSFVAADDLYAPSIDYYVIGPSYYRGFIGRTANWTRFSIYNGHVFNRSIDRDRFRTTFGHELREGRRHDFEGRLGPVTDYQSGRQIEARERSTAHAVPTVERGTRMYYGAGGGTTAHTTHEGSVHVIRAGSSSETSTEHHTTSHVTHHTTTSHTTTIHHTTTTLHTTTPTEHHSTVHTTPSYHSSSGSHPTPSYHFAPSGSHGSPPSSHSSTPPNGNKPH